MVGDLIRSLSSVPGKKHIELEVVQTTWVPKIAFTNTRMRYRDGGPDLMYLEVELHLPKGRYENLEHFEKFVKSWLGD